MIRNIGSVTEVHDDPDWDGCEGLIALVISNTLHEPGARFFTAPESPMQVGILNYPKGHKIPAHAHRDAPRTISRTTEVLIIKRGTAKAEIFSSAGVPLASPILDQGDVLILFKGGHSFEMLDDCEIYEIKQGPFVNCKISLKPQDR